MLLLIADIRKDWSNTDNFDPHRPDRHTGLRQSAWRDQVSGACEGRDRLPSGVRAGDQQDEARRPCKYDGHDSQWDEQRWRAIDEGERAAGMLAVEKIGPRDDRSFSFGTFITLNETSSGSTARSSFA